MSTLAWVVGSGGLLGSHLCGTLERQAGLRVFGPGPGSFPWSDRRALERELRTAVGAFMRSAAEGGHEAWRIFWCAGSGSVGASADGLAAEFETWQHFLACLAEALAGARQLDGQIFLASSAGGVYGESPERPLRESSPCRPISEYGSFQLRREQLLEEWARGQPRISRLVARISNLYGPGQNMDKPQGLISQMSRCLIQRRPIHIYVPLDTIRDYLFVEDAARRIALWMARIAAEAGRAGDAQSVLKICASEEETTIASLIGLFRRMAKKQLKVISGLHPARAQQPAHLQFRSEVWLDEPRGPSTGLVTGIDRVYRHQLALYQAGRLSAPRLAVA